MRLIEAERLLLTLKQPILQTRDVSAFLDIPLAQASKILDRLEKAGRFVHLMRGKWATSAEIDAMILPEYLTAPFPSYISLQTALFFHGMISQIPSSIYAVSLARTRQYETGLGQVSIHHLQPNFFFGFEVIDQIKMATPEKALIDVFYLASAKSKLFRKLPEIELPHSFSRKKAVNIINKIAVTRIRTRVLAEFEMLLSRS